MRLPRAPGYEPDQVPSPSSSRASPAKIFTKLLRSSASWIRPELPAATLRECLLYQLRYHQILLSKERHDRYSRR